MPAAWATMCVQWSTWNVGILHVCLESIASLLFTSATPNVPLVVLVDSHAMASIGDLLQRQPGVHVVQLVHQNATALMKRDWTRLYGAGKKRRKTMVPREVTSLLKLQAFNLTSFTEVCWFDSDVLFLRNASELLTAAAPFASIVLRHSTWGCGGRDYINDGVMLFHPAAAAYRALYDSFISGDFLDCGGSEKTLGDQDVVRHHLFETRLLGPFHEWPICYNYRGWPWQRQCNQSELLLFHGSGSSPLRPKTIRASGRKLVVAELPRRLGWAHARHQTVAP